MTPEQKCVSLETAKKLRDAGFPQKNIERYWMNDIAQNPGKYKDEWYIRYADDWPLTTEPDYIKFDDTLLYSIAAPDAQELGEVLLSKDFECEMTRNPYLNSWAICIRKNGQIENVFDDDKNEAEARAAAWLWLKEHKLI